MTARPIKKRARKPQVEHLTLPHPQHFIGGADCRFWRASLVRGRYVVSTVGDYHPTNAPAGRNGSAKGDSDQALAHAIESLMDDGEWRSRNEICTAVPGNRSRKLTYVKRRVESGAYIEGSRGVRKASVPEPGNHPSAKPQQTQDSTPYGRYPAPGTTLEPPLVSPGGSRFLPPLGGEPEPEPGDSDPSEVLS